MIMDDCSWGELKVKNFKSDKFYSVTNVWLAEQLIKMSKWPWFTEEQPHWKYKDKMQTVYCFEYSREIVEVAKELKERRYK